MTTSAVKGQSMENIRAGFAEVDICPQRFPARIYWGSTDKVLDPIYVKAAVFATGASKVVMLSFDVVIVEWEYVQALRQGVAAALRIPESHILVCATHNHACPAVVDRPGAPKDEEYAAFIVLLASLFVITGGIAKNVGVVRRLERALGVEARISPEPQIVGALGAAIFARELAERKSRRGDRATAERRTSPGEGGTS